ncbi:CCC motif membrane protein [Chryseobacterium sp.]|uniref:CCC motif membrane protein n=1 Tax=Chryseobacterium sp. TaxID=1871047 RepID=UPI0011CAC5BC|nr:CCC motif membrane protein [Chryseobacterium sp.]TXF74889.1 DUF4190 domain-containing protein [Chryseobacterium sp.]
MNQQKLPNATAVLILGIISIVGCCFYGIGLICGIIGLVLAKKDEALYNGNPTLYSDYQNLKTGKILCYIGLALSILAVILMIVMGATLGWDAMMDQQLMEERMKDLMGQ